jgi:rare lipoprotein A
MTPRPPARAIALTVAGLSLALPAAAVASGSGSGPGGASGGAGLSGASGAVATPVGGPISAQGDGFILSSSSVGTYRRNLDFSGSVAPSDQNDVVSIQRQTRAGRWRTIAQATVATGGSFSAAWSPSTSGLVGFRATLGGPAGTAQAASASPAPASPTLAVTIYANAIATIYGPGFYGHRTACGFRLTPATIGVASRTLKCGTKVSLDYDGQTITVPVIDRGPYANGATWDLTEATAQALGDEETETVGAAVL